ncbi:MAG: NAD(P)/FAD-dependent oxidoreductase [Pseudomonadota bacterium]
MTTTATGNNYDVIILGAGLAGLTLARQLSLRSPGRRIALLEHRRFPMREAAHKVGESTVEIASHYFAETLGLEQHLRAEQLPKFGLRLFLRGADPIADDLARYDEVGASQPLPIATYQLDRGRFENHLGELVSSAGVDLLDGATVRTVDLTPGAHQVRIRRSSGNGATSAETTLKARFLVDASGRRALLRTQQDLKKPARHDNHALWFRVEGALDLDRWSSDTAWQARCMGTPRRLSTNHFSGPGYWLWLIPLAGNYTSVGLVFDPKIVDSGAVRSHDKLLHWLAAEHPLLADQLAGLPPLDFHFLENYAASCRQVFSPDGWALSGDAGLFADPFYSPGSDFIAFSNSYITELIERDDPAATTAFQNELLSFFTNTLSLYRGQYGGFGDRDFMIAKTVWDYAYYWAVLSKLYFGGRFTDLDFMSQQKPALLRASALNSGIQKRFRALAGERRRIGGTGRFFDHYDIPDFHRLKQELLRDAARNDAQADAAELTANVDWLAQVVPQVAALSAGQLAPELVTAHRSGSDHKPAAPRDLPSARGHAAAG